MQSGKLIIFSAPSGAGKTTIVKKLLKDFPNLEFSISACSREKRPKEIDGKDYYFLSAEEFKTKIENNEFLEWEEVYPGSFYGTLKSEVERIWANGKHVIFDVDVVGGMNIKNYYNEKALAIFIMPPSVEELENRLQRRDTETQESLKKRIAKAEHEMTFADKFDTIVVNTVLEDAVSETKLKTKNFLKENEA